MKNISFSRATFCEEIYEYQFFWSWDDCVDITILCKQLLDLGILLMDVGIGEQVQIRGSNNKAHKPSYKHTCYVAEKHTWWFTHIADSDYTLQSL